MKSRIHSYQTEAITVRYDAVRCIHAEECIKRLSAVFDTKKRPWIQPQQAAADALAATIHECPSGALHYQRQDGGAGEPTPDANIILLAENGPLYVRGDVILLGADDQPLLEDTRIALCRCGASENKPLCDNTHLKTGFQASAPAASSGAVVAVSGGKLTIKASRNGSLALTGNFSIQDASGQVIFSGSQTWLCRCGGSANKPFCDDTHKRNGFQSE